MSAAGSTSFRKKARVKVGQIVGTKPSLYNNQLLISTGIPSLDYVIGGGLAVGTVLLVEEDTYGSYAKLMLKYFVAEALVTQQSVFLSSADGSVQQLVKELPGTVDEVSAQTPAKVTSPSPSTAHPHTGTQAAGDPGSIAHSEDEKMKIAWRYQNSPKVQVLPSAGTQFGHYYDLTKTMDTGLVHASDISYWSTVRAGQTSVVSAVPDMNPNYWQLLQEIKNKIQAGCFGTAQEVEKRSILRIGIHSLGSPLWGESADGRDPSLPLLLLALRGILRTAFAAAMITVPAHLFYEKAFLHRVERLADTVIRLESFAGSDKEKNPVFKEYHGLLHVLQVPRLNSLVPAQPETSDLAFKLRRKKFTIEKLHLPPELADTTGRSQDEDSIMSRRVGSGSGCGSSRTADLSF
ncbi:hypothetical protein BsWGS_06987 [Bradybaena similaris]